MKFETYFENFSNYESGYSGNYDGGSGNDDEDPIDIDGSELSDTCAGNGNFIFFQKMYFEQNKIIMLDLSFYGRSRFKSWFVFI